VPGKLIDNQGKRGMINALAPVAFINRTLARLFKQPDNTVDIAARGDKTVDLSGPEAVAQAFLGNTRVLLYNAVQFFLAAITGV
jgi:hypothetical protein